MKTPTHAALAAVTLSAALLTPGTAQDPAAPAAGDAALIAAADAVVESLVPRTDDPERVVRRLAESFAAIRSHRFATSLGSRMSAEGIDTIDPRAALELLDGLPTSGIHGEAAHSLEVARLDYLRTLGLKDRIPSTFRGYANQAWVVGPFGDAGDYHNRIPFAPEKSFPAPGTRIPGRYGPVQPHLARRPPGRFRIPVQDPRAPGEGCHYALFQFHAEAEVRCYVRVFVDGSFTVFVNGKAEARRNVDVDERYPPYFVPAVLRAGHNHILVKTGDNGMETIGLRLVDVDGAALSRVREHDALEGILPFAATPPRITPPPTWQDGPDALAAILPRLEGADRDRVRIACAVTARTPTQTTAILYDLLNKPPTDPRLRLALAPLARIRGLRLPEAYLKAKTRSLVEGLGTSLGDSFAKFREDLALLESEDRWEEVARRLKARIEAGKHGPETFATLVRIARKLGDWAQFRRAEELWMKTYPAHIQPRRSAMSFRQSSEDTSGALRLAQEGLRHHPGNAVFLQRVLATLAARGDTQGARETAARLIDVSTQDEYDLLVWHEFIERQSGRQEAALDLATRVAEHPRTSRDDRANHAYRLLRGGRTDAAKRILDAIQRDAPAGIKVRKTLAALRGEDPFPNLQRFRIDMEKEIRNFRPGPREEGASSTLVVDQIIVEVMPDGSYAREVHSLRRINDLAGVERYEEAKDAASANRILRLRTIDVDGRSYVPSRVEDSFSMPRLKPGVFIESATRSTYSPARPGPERITTFYYQSQDEPFVRSELVLITPPGFDVPIRTRGEIAAPEVTVLADGKTARIYRRDNVPRLPTEDMAPPLDELIPIVAIGEDGNPASKIREHAVSSAYSSRPTPPIEEKTRAVIAGHTTDAAKARAIHAFLQETIAPANTVRPTQVLLERKGVRFFLEVAMLRAAGIPFQDGLAEDENQHEGMRRPPLFASNRAFEISCALVRPRGAAPYWLFADAPRYYPAGMVANDRLGARALLIEDGTAKMVRLPKENPGFDEALRGRGMITLAADGSAEMTVTLTFPNAIGFTIAEYVRGRNRREQVMILRQLMSQSQPGWTIRGEVEMAGEKTEPLRLTARFRRRGMVQGEGATRLLTPPLTANRWVAQYGGRSERKLPFRMDTHRGEDWEIRVDPGTHFTFGALPAETAIEAAGMVKWRQEFTQADGVVTVRRRYDLRPGQIAAAGFGPWRQELSKIDAAEALRLELVPNKK